MTILRLLQALAILAFSFLSVFSQAAPASVQAGDQTVTVQFYTPATVRVTKTPANATSSAPASSMSVIAEPQDVAVKIKEGKNSLSASSGQLTVTIDKKRGVLTFIQGGKTLLRENGGAVFTPYSDAGNPSYRMRQDFRLDKDEAIYGLGNLENGRLSQRGVNVKLMPGNVEDGIPVMVSPKGYGLYWDNYSPTSFCDTIASTTFLESQVGDRVDYYFMGGGDIDGTISELRELTGRVPMFPLWTYGYWQSRERYKSQREITDVVRRYREAGIPLDGIIQDWQYWGSNYLWNAMEFMNQEFADPQRMVDDIHGLNAHLIVSIWSSFGPHTKPYSELAEKGLLFDFATWPRSGIDVWPPRMDYPSGVKVYDAYSPEARDIYWKHLSRISSLGIDGWWMDSTEPDHFEVKESDFDTPTAMGTFRSVRNAYPLLTVGNVHDRQRQAWGGQKRVFILTRSGYAGQQRYGCNVWTGDVPSSWENLRKQVPAMLNFTMTGNPNANSDLGGFFAGSYNFDGDNSATRNPMFQELYVRWMQMGVGTPMMRSHGTDIKREIYYFGNAGEPVYDALAGAVMLRYALLPYLYSTAWNVTSRNASFMNPLASQFAADRSTHDRGDAFMLGHNLLIAPITEAHYTPESLSSTDENSGWSRKERFAALVGECDFSKPYQTGIYLPKGTDWWDFNTGERLAGGQTATIEATLATLPIFLRAGSILPIGPDVQYANEKPWDNLEIRVYPGADGSFTLYEDELDNYNYESGAFSTIEMRWDDKARTLTIGDRKGEFPGMLQSRRFQLRLMDPSCPSAILPVDYYGAQVTVSL